MGIGILRIGERRVILVISLFEYKIIKNFVTFFFPQGESDFTWNGPKVSSMTYYTSLPCSFKGNTRLSIIIMDKIAEE